MMIAFYVLSGRIDKDQRISGMINNTVREGINSDAFAMLLFPYSGRNKHLL